MVQTRSSTKRIKPQQVQDDPPIQDPGSRSSRSVRPKRRRQDSTAAAPKKKRREPSSICQLNLDVLFLIAEYIQPMDLLNLARTCTSFRQLLMTNSSAFVWKAARRQVHGLPDCPPDLAEPQYANLVFHPRCHGCGTHTKAVLWHIRRRYCPDCRAERLCGVNPYEADLEMFRVLATEQIVVEGEVVTLGVDREQKEFYIREYKRCSDKQQYIQDKKEQLVAISEHARQCEKWQKDKALKHKFDRDRRRRKRDNSILDRLEHLGYEEEVLHFGRHRIKSSCKVIFGKSRPLTDKEWDRVWPELAKTMDGLRSQRLEESRKRVSWCGALTLESDVRCAACGQERTKYRR